jgi:hypothetical protein
MRTLLCTLIIALGAGVAHAQTVPHDFRQDTPPVPGQIVIKQRDKLRLSPTPLYRAPSPALGLPTSGQKGVVRESSNEWQYAPRDDR